jgi:hypothetical protein
MTALFLDNDYLLIDKTNKKYNDLDEIDHQ